MREAAAVLAVLAAAGAAIWFLFDDFIRLATAR